jgi:membrane protein DedA with SNARE-associated domain/membrane-associated phospholipid phosphatase
MSELFNSTLHWIAAHPGWMGLIVFLTAMGESLFLVGLILPGAVMMFGFGALIAWGYLKFWPAFAWGVAGAVAGDSLSFWLGRTFHQHLRQLWPFSTHPEMLIRGEDFFQRHGGKSVLFGRFFGPVRPVIPAVAGMLDMPVGRFLLVNMLSALLWAPAHLLPGMVFAASLELASQVAVRLGVLILLVGALLWLTSWLVRHGFRLLQPHVQDWLKRLSTWSRDRPLLGPLLASLLNPAQGEVLGLVTLAFLLLGSMVFINLLLAAAGQRLPTPLDLSLYHFLQNLRTPWADQWMVLITELGDTPVGLSLTMAVLAWLSWQRAYSAALHWLAALGFGLATGMLFKWLLQVPRPLELYQGISSYSFPSDHATLSTILFGFLAVLVARQMPPARRWRPYLAAALLIVPIAFSRLYLGAHWLSDTLGGLSLGVIWVALLGLAYARHRAPPLNRRGLVLVSLSALLVSELSYAILHHHDELDRYRVRSTIQTMTRDDWWQGNWQRLPAYRLDWRGSPQQPLVLQWAGSQQELERRLLAAGWQKAPAWQLQSILLWLSPQVQLVELPVLPRVHDGRHEKLALVHPGNTPKTRWVVRFWDSRIRLEPGAVRVWLGSLTLQRLEHRRAFFTMAVDVPVTQFPWELLTPALQGLHQQVVNPSAHQERLMLIAD